MTGTEAKLFEGVPETSSWFDVADGKVALG
jgi:hypothetical protein